MLDGEKTVFWVKPDLEKEHTAVRRVAKEFGIAQRHILESLQTAELRKLDSDTWRRLRNTDSKRVRPGHVSDVKQILSDTSKNWERVKEAYEEGGTLPSAIILLLSDGTPYLLAGNVRLMMAKAMRDTPKVLIGQLPKSLGVTWRTLVEIETTKRK